MDDSTMVTLTAGWWIEYDDSPDSNPFAPEAPWRATLQAQAGCFTLNGIAFFTEAQCLDFIRTEIIGKPLLEDQTSDDDMVTSPEADPCTPRRPTTRSGGTGKATSRKSRP